MHRGHIWVLVWISKQSDHAAAFCLSNKKTLQGAGTASKKSRCRLDESFMLKMNTCPKKGVFKSHVFNGNNLGTRSLMFPFGSFKELVGWMMISNVLVSKVKLKATSVFWVFATLLDLLLKTAFKDSYQEPAGLFCIWIVVEIVWICFVFSLYFA